MIVLQREKEQRLGRELTVGLPVVLIRRKLRVRRPQRAADVRGNLVNTRQFFSRKLARIRREFATIRHNSAHFESKSSDLVVCQVEMQHVDPERSRAV